MAQGLKEDEELIAGINVTPLVDIVLVILIIFIVTASFVLRSSIPLDLPKAKTAEESTGGLLNVAITKDGEVYINGRPGSLDELPTAIEAARDRQGKEVSAFVSADIKAQYGAFAEVIDRLRLEGVTEIALDTQPADLSELEQ